MAKKKFELESALGYGGFGVLLGLGLDQGVFVLDAYVPKLATPIEFTAPDGSKIPLKVPFYDQKNGIHIDDLVVQAINLSVLGYGIISKKPKLIATGVGMVIGAILSSRVQGNPVKPFAVEAMKQVNTTAMTHYPYMAYSY